MTVVNPKSISGINSITTGSGSDDILTIHTNNGTERLRVDSTGTTKIVTGIVTTLTATTGIVTTFEATTGNITTLRAPTGIVTTLTANTTTHLDDVTFTGANYNVVWDKSDNSLEFADNVKAKFGSGDDTHLYHNGSHTYISHRGTGDLILEPKEGENGVVLKTDGAVELYYDNSKKFQTYTNGIQFFGNIKNETDGTNQGMFLGAANDLQMYHDGTRSAINNRVGELRISAADNIRLGYSASGNDTSVTENYAVFKYNGAVELFHDNTKQCETSANGLAFPSGKGIDFSADASADGTADELLDDYEEGTFTPNNTIGMPLTSNFPAQYVKVGNLCHIMMDITFNSSPTDTSQCGLIQSLPFSAKTLTNGEQYVNFPFISESGSNNLDHDLANTVTFIESNGTSIKIFNFGLNAIQQRAFLAGRRMRFNFCYRTG